MQPYTHSRDAHHQEQQHEAYVDEQGNWSQEQGAWGEDEGAWAAGDAQVKAFPGQEEAPHHHNYGPYQQDWYGEHAANPWGQQAWAAQPQYPMAGGQWEQRQWNHKAGGGVGGCCAPGGICSPGSRTCAFVSMRTGGIVGLFMSTIFFIIAGIVHTLPCCGPVDSSSTTLQLKKEHGACNTQTRAGYMEVDSNGDPVAPEEAAPRLQRNWTAEDWSAQPCKDNKPIWLAFYILGGIFFTVALVAWMISNFSCVFWEDSTDRRSKAQKNAEAAFEAEMHKVQEQQGKRDQLRAVRKEREQQRQLEKSERKEERKWDELERRERDLEAAEAEAARRPRAHSVGAIPLPRPVTTTTTFAASRPAVVPSASFVVGAGATSRTTTRTMTTRGVSSQPHIVGAAAPVSTRTTTVFPG